MRSAGRTPVCSGHCQPCRAESLDRQTPRPRWWSARHCHEGLRVSGRSAGPGCPSRSITPLDAGHASSGRDLWFQGQARLLQSRGRESIHPLRLPVPRCSESLQVTNAPCRPLCQGSGLHFRRMLRSPCLRACVRLCCTCAHLYAHVYTRIQHVYGRACVSDIAAYTCTGAQCVCVDLCILWHAE